MGPDAVRNFGKVPRARSPHAAKAILLIYKINKYD
jgi:hypothetical protein